MDEPRATGSVVPGLPQVGDEIEDVAIEDVTIEDVAIEDVAIEDLPIEHQEIEHKFLVGEDFDRTTFRRTLEAMGPGRRVELVVRDTYFLLDGDQPLVYRHRFDEELQELTVKSLGADAAVRLEVNLDLGHHRGDQLGTAQAFLAAQGIAWQDTVHKDIDVFHFDDCEVVYYRAWTAERTLHCVEFEAVHKPTLAEAFAVLDRYEKATGFENARREPRSLPQLIFPEVFSTRAVAQRVPTR